MPKVFYEYSNLSDKWIYNERGEIVCNLSAWINEAKIADKRMSFSQGVGVYVKDLDNYYNYKKTIT